MQAALFHDAAVRVGPARPRSAGDGGYVSEYVQIEPGVWAVCVFILIPKNGFGHLHFPAYWGAPQASPRWRVDRHGTEVPDGTFIFTSRAEAQEVVAETFGDNVSNIYRCMSWISIPSDDHRPRAADRRGPYHQPLIHSPLNEETPPMPDVDPETLTAYCTTDPVAIAAYRTAVAARTAFAAQLRAAASEIGHNNGAVRGHSMFGGPETVAGLAPDDSGIIPQGWRMTLRNRLEPARQGKGAAAAQRWLAEHQPGPECDPRYVLKAHGLAYQSRVGGLHNHLIFLPKLGERDGALWALYTGIPDGDFPGDPSGLTWEQRPVEEYRALHAAAEAEEAAQRDRPSQDDIDKGAAVKNEDGSWSISPTNADFDWTTAQEERASGLPGAQDADYSDEPHDPAEQLATF